ncbi:MAG: DUF4837 family protein [Bacteroidales bacterium]|nr:DUF4837 family protein [Bacteroidales bacterium]
MKLLSAICLAIVMSLSSCGDSSLTRTLPNVTGASGEVLVVIDRDLWNNETGKTIRDEVAAILVGLPQPEPAFTLLHVNPEGFREIFLAHRNIIIAQIDRNTTEPSVTYTRNRWAETQLVINLTAPDSDSMQKIVSANASAIRQRINDVERERLTAWLKNSAGKEKSIVTSADRSYEIIMPAGYKSDFNRDGRMMISAETPSTTQSVIVSFSERMTSVIGCIELADMTEKITSAEVKGPDRQSYMIIEKQVPASCRSFRRNDIEYIEMRGLWTLEGGFMGGPFITYAFIDPETSRAIIVTGFVYAPRDEKRELLRQVEALMYTVLKSN